MELENLLSLIDKVSSSELTDFSFEEGNIRLSMGKKKKNVIVAPSANHAGASALAAEASALSQGMPDVMPEQAGSVAAAAIYNGNIIKAPLVGTFYISSSPDARPYVQPGDTVKKGQVVGIIEAMKLMNEIESEYDGVVEEILSESQQMVEYGQPLFKIR